MTWKLIKKIVQYISFPRAYKFLSYLAIYSNARCLYIFFLWKEVLDVALQQKLDDEEYTR